jgi:hypothetical protein
MKAAELRIFCSANGSDQALVKKLATCLHQALPDFRLNWFEDFPPDAYRREAADFINRADLFLAFNSEHYLESTDQNWEIATLLETRQGRPNLRVVIIQCKQASVPESLRGFLILPAMNDPVLQPFIDEEGQLLRVASAIRDLLSKNAESDLYEGQLSVPLSLQDMKDRLKPLLDRTNFSNCFHLFRELVNDPVLIQNLFEAEDAFRNLVQQASGLKTELTQLELQKNLFKKLLAELIQEVKEQDLKPNWRSLFSHLYFSFHAKETTHAPLYFYLPTDEVQVPGGGETEGKGSARGESGLDAGQKQTFKRSFMLAQDALALGNYGSALYLCEHLRHHIDPESAQLYEYLLIAYLSSHKPAVILQNCLVSDGKMLSNIVLFSTRMRTLQEAQKCPSASETYNRAVAAEVLTDGMYEIYESWDFRGLLDTGTYAAAALEKRKEAAKLLEHAQHIFQNVFPAPGMLRILINELCGGGKFFWISRVALQNQAIRVLTDLPFDLERKIIELIGMLNQSSVGGIADTRRCTEILRDNLYYALQAKARQLNARLAEEDRLGTHFTDRYDAYIRMIQSCLLGYRIFGDPTLRSGSMSFIKMAFEHLLPEMLYEPAHSPSVMWFDYNLQGEFIVHEEAEKRGFDAKGILEFLLDLLKDKTSWLKQTTNVRDLVYLKLITQTDSLFEAVKAGLEVRDVRRWDALRARKQLILCLQRWMAAREIFSEKSQEFLDKIIREISGDGLLLWLQLDPLHLTTHPESIACGFDARKMLKVALGASTQQAEAEIQQRIAINLFEKRIIPTATLIPAGDPMQKQLMMNLLLECLSLYRLESDLRFLDFVYEELTLERKFKWLDINLKSEICNHEAWEASQFSPLGMLDSLVAAHPDRYRAFEIRERVAESRMQDLEELYQREISEFRKENKTVERETAIYLIRRAKSIYQFFPVEAYLNIPMAELTGKGRINWNSRFLGIFPTQENHHENQHYEFDFRMELKVCRRLLAQQEPLMQKVLDLCGEIPPHLQVSE